LPHGQPAAPQVADVVIRQAYELQEETRYAVDDQKQPGDTQAGSWLRREPPHDREQHDAFQAGLVELRGMTDDPVHIEAPRHRRRLAPELTVDEVTDASEEQAQ